MLRSELKAFAQGIVNELAAEFSVTASATVYDAQGEYTTTEGPTGRTILSLANGYQNQSYYGERASIAWPVSDEDRTLILNDLRRGNNT